MRLYATVFFALCVLLPPAAAAGTDSDAEKCRNGNPDAAIQHCTRALSATKLSPERALLHFDRGVALMAKGEFDRAIADFNAAITANAKLKDAYYNRGIAWANKGDPDRAIADFDTALAANAKHADALQARAIEWMVKGDYARAIADFDAARKVDPGTPDALFPRGRALFYAGDYAAAVAALARAHQAKPSDYTALWLFLARRHAGATNAEDLVEHETRGTRGEGWPSGVIALYAGQAEPEAVMKSAADRDAHRQAEQHCEGYFYIAHWHLLQKAADRALPLFEQAAGACAKNGIEYEGALAALRRLKSHGPS